MAKPVCGTGPVCGTVGVDVGSQWKQFPKSWHAAIEDWVGLRYCSFSSNDSIAITSTWTSIVMSHRHRRPERSALWRGAIDKSLQKCRAAHSALLASNATPIGDYLIQAARRAQVHVIQLQLPLRNESVVDWQKRIGLVPLPSDIHDIAPFHFDQKDPRLTQFWISPIIESMLDHANCSDHEHGQISNDFNDLPLVDRMLMALANSVHVISVAPQSKTEQLIRQRLSDYRFPEASVFVVMDDLDRNDSATAKKSKSNRTKPKKRICDQTRNSMLDCGAIGWWQALRPQEDGFDTRKLEHFGGQHHSYPVSPDNPRTVVPILMLAEMPSHWMREWPYLTHCTRAPTGAWPDQSMAGYFDSLLMIEGDAISQITPFHTLERILQQQRLIASNNLKRSRVPTVSLTKVPLLELLTRRHFHSHVGRWDWEPYGICIHQAWIERHGGRRVTYLNSSQWNDLPLAEQPYFHPSSSSDGKKNTEWATEQEWRMLDDVHLAEIPFEAAIVFVPTLQEALELASISRFSILVIDR